MAIFVLFSGSMLAAVSVDEAKQLGYTLTAWGAEKAGNNEGTIPEYTGQPIPKPASYDTKDPGQKPDNVCDKKFVSP
jgi:hypothetical protein